MNFDIMFKDTHLTGGYVLLWRQKREILRKTGLVENKIKYQQKTIQDLKRDDEGKNLYCMWLNDPNIHECWGARH